MTPVDVVFRYSAAPTESTMVAIGQMSNVYGIRRLQLKETDRTIRVEFDATRLTAAKVEGLLRAAGFDLTKQLALV